MLSALRNFALTFLISAIIFGGLAYFVVGFVLDTLSVAISADGPVEDTTPINLVRPDETEPDDTTGLSPEEELNGETFNILLIGSDYQPELFDDYDYEETWVGSGFPDRRSRKWGADTLVLLRVDKENRKFVFCSLPRNTRVQVDGSYMQLGDVYSQKGIDYLCGKVSGLIGYEIHYWAALDVGAIADCVDAIGSITYYVAEDMYYEDPEQNLAIDLKKGTVTLDGEKAAQLLRYVGYANGNVGRMNTAVQFLQAMLSKFTNVTYLSKATELYKAATEHIATNFTVDDLINNLDLIFAYSKFESVTVVYPGTTKSYEGVSYFEPSVAAAMDIFDSYQ